MASIQRYDPYREGLSLRNAIDQLFAQSFVNPFWAPTAANQMMLAPMDVCETQNGYEVDVALPGVKPNNIDVTVHNNTLDIRGSFSREESQPQAQSAQGQAGTQATGTQTQSQQSQKGTQTQAQHGQGEQRNWLMREISAGSFERTLTFPQPIDADKITTNYENGILKIFVPLSEASKPKKITVQSGQGQSHQHHVTVEANQNQ